MERMQKAMDYSTQVLASDGQDVALRVKRKNQQMRAEEVEESANYILRKSFQ
jgi:hypothetical protein